MPALNSIAKKATEHFERATLHNVMQYCTSEDPRL